jgi:hypothetical protein
METDFSEYNMAVHLISVWMAGNSTKVVFVLKVNDNLIGVVLPVKVDGIERFLCWTVIQFAEALSFQIAL